MEKCLKLPQMGPGGVFLTNPDLANILGRTEMDSDNYVLLVIFSVPQFPDFQVPDFQISRNLAHLMPMTAAHDLKPGE